MQPMNAMITLAGKEYELRFDIMALTSAQGIMKQMGFHRENVWSLADSPYDLGEEVILVTHGINGAKRAAKDKNMVTLDDVQEYFQDHFEYVASKIELIEDEKEAMEAFQKEHAGLMEQLGNAVRAGIGFRRAATKGGAKRGK